MGGSEFEGRGYVRMRVLWGGGRAVADELDELEAEEGEMEGCVLVEDLRGFPLVKRAESLADIAV